MHEWVLIFESGIPICILSSPLHSHQCEFPSGPQRFKKWCAVRKERVKSQFLFKLKKHVLSELFMITMILLLLHTPGSIFKTSTAKNNTWNLVNPPPGWRLPSTVEIISHSKINWPNMSSVDSLLRWVFYYLSSWHNLSAYLLCLANVFLFVT